MELSGRITGLIRDVPDFPTPGILFKDIGPLLADSAALTEVAAALAALAAEHGATLIAGIESRGFLLGAPAAVRAGLGFVPLRKAGRLPGPVATQGYGLEYGQAELEIQRGVIPAGTRVLIIDDVLATGGTAAAAVALLRAVGAEPVHLGVLLELGFLNGRTAIPELGVTALASA